MKRYVFACLTLLLATVTVAAQARRYEMDMGQYNNVRVLNDIDVDIVCNSDSAGKVVFVAEDKAVQNMNVMFGVEESLGLKLKPTGF